jgi:hypothetical protein
MVDRREPTVCWECYEAVGHKADCPYVSKPRPERSPASEIVLAAIVALACGGAVIGFVLFVTGCTPAQQTTATSATVTGVRIAACVQSVLAEEEQARALAHRLAETAAELEAEELRSVAREHGPTVKEEIEKVMREGSKD